MNVSREQILGILANHSEQIRGYGVRSLGLFGSFARGDQAETSDLDFVVEFEAKSFDAYMELKQFLEELFQRRVDLVLPNTIKPRLRERILAETIYAQGL